MRKITVDYDNAFREANRLLEIGEEHTQEADRIEALKNELCSKWSDAAAREFALSCDTLIRSMRATARELIVLAGQIRNEAAAYREQEERNAKNARGLPN